MKKWITAILKFVTCSWVVYQMILAWFENHTVFLNLHLKTENLWENMSAAAKPATFWPPRSRSLWCTFSLVSIADPRHLNDFWDGFCVRWFVMENLSKWQQRIQTFRKVLLIICRLRSTPMYTNVLFGCHFEEKSEWLFIHWLARVWQTEHEVMLNIMLRKPWMQGHHGQWRVFHSPQLKNFCCIGGEVQHQGAIRTARLVMSFDQPSLSLFDFVVVCKRESGGSDENGSNHVASESCCCRHQNCFPQMDGMIICKPKTTQSCRLQMSFCLRPEVFSFSSKIFWILEICPNRPHRLKTRTEF